jgi:hypothetical protein
MITLLKRARVNAGYKTATEAIEKFYWKASLYRAHESGSLKFDIETASIYAKAYKVPISSLIPDHPEERIKSANES